MSGERDRRVAIANRILPALAPEVSLAWRPRYGVVIQAPEGERGWRFAGRAKKCHNGTWLHRGHTCEIAIGQLVRWVRGLPVLGLVSWRYWAAHGLLRHPPGPDATIKVMQDCGTWPERSRCVLCGIELESADWWGLDGVSGPCCQPWSGCQAQGGRVT